MRYCLLLGLAGALAVPVPAKKAPKPPRPPRAGVATSAKAGFRRTNPCPSTGKITGACPGYKLQYIQPLQKGGMDTPSNLDWRRTGAGSFTVSGATPRLNGMLVTGTA